MPSLASLAGSSLYGTYTQGTNGLPGNQNAGQYSGPLNYIEPTDDAIRISETGATEWAIGSNFAFGNPIVKKGGVAGNINFFGSRQSSLMRAGNQGTSFHGPNNTSPGIGTGNYMDPFGGPIGATTFNDVLSGQAYVNTNGQGPGTYTDQRGNTGVTPPF
jgi:hypothetical protein